MGDQRQTGMGPALFPGVLWMGKGWRRFASAVMARSDGDAASPVGEARLLECLGWGDCRGRIEVRLHSQELAALRSQ